MNVNDFDTLEEYRAARKKAADEAIEQLVIFLGGQIRSGEMEGIVRQTHFRRPFTVVMLRDRQGRIGVGAARKFPADQWSDEIGEEVATRRAVRDLAKHIYASTVKI